MDRNQLKELRDKIDEALAEPDYSQATIEDVMRRLDEIEKRLNGMPSIISYPVPLPTIPTPWQQPTITCQVRIP